MLLDGIITLLADDSGVSGLVGDRIYKSVLPRGYTLPALAVHRYGNVQEYDFSGPVSQREDQVQVDIYGPDAETAQTVAEAVRYVLVGFVGILPDGTVVKACYLERDMDMPFLPHADTKGIADRTLIGFRIVSAQ